MAVHPPNLAKALLRWVQTFETDPAIEQLSDLREGHVLQQILHNIDPTYFGADGLPADRNETANNWVQRWQNLRHIQHNVDGYARDVCGVVGDSAAGHANLKAVAQAEGQAADADIVEMLKTVLRAAMYSPESNQRMGRVVVGLGAEVAGTIAAAMASMEDERYDDGDSVVQEQEQSVMNTARSASPSGPGKMQGTPPNGSKTSDRDLELEHEEKLISAHRIIRQLEESNAKAAHELEDLRAEKQRIETAFEALEQDKHRDSADDQHLRALRDRSDQDRDYIAELETELETARTTSESQARQLERLKSTADTVQKLKDDLQLLRAERDELSSKSRTNENLRKKIQNMQDAEKQSSQLREDLRLAHDQLASMDQLRDRCEALQKSVAENMNIIASSEQEIFDMRSARKRLEHELRVLGQKYDNAREKQSRDHEAITELEARLQQLQVDGEQGLGDEMDAAERPLVERKVSISGVKTGEVQGMLEERLAALGRRNDKLKEDYLELLGDKLGLEAALAELRDGQAGSADGNNPFLEQRARLATALKEIESKDHLLNVYKSGMHEAQSKLGKHQADPASVESNDVATSYADLAEEYKQLQKEAAGVQLKMDDARELLRYALLLNQGIDTSADAQDKWAKEYECAVELMNEATTKQEGEVRYLAEKAVGRIKLLHDAEEKKGSPDAAQDHIAAELEKAKEELRVLKEKGLESGPGDNKVEMEQVRREMAQLKRENQLMSSAWWDMTARMQRENVVLGRRRESPKSWLGKQRGAVGLGLR